MPATLYLIKDVAAERGVTPSQIHYLCRVRRKAYLDGEGKLEFEKHFIGTQRAVTGPERKAILAHRRAPGRVAAKPGKAPTGHVVA